MLHLQYEVNAKAREIELIVNNLKESLIHLSSLPKLEAYLGGEGSLKEKIVLENVFVAFAERHPELYQLRFINEHGDEIIRINNRDGQTQRVGDIALQNKVHRYYFQEAMLYQRGNVYISPMDLNIEHHVIEIPHRLVVRFATPVFDRNGEKKGILIMNLFGQSILDQVYKLTSVGGVASFLVEGRSSFLLKSQQNEHQTQYEIISTDTLKTLFGERIVSDMTNGKSGVIYRQDKKDILVFSPIYGSAGMSTPWAVALQYPRKLIFSSAFELIAGMIVIGIVVLFFSAVTAYLASKHFTQPLLALQRETERISQGDYEYRLHIHTNDEIEDLAEKFNLMAGELKSLTDKLTSMNEHLQEEVEKKSEELLNVEREKEKVRRGLERQLFQAEKLASLGELSAGVAHEIGNPLAAIKTMIQAIDNGEVDVKTGADYFGRILKEINKLNHFLKTFSSFTKGQKPNLHGCNIRKIVDDVIVLVRDDAQKRKIEIFNQLGKEMPRVMVDFQQIGQVFLNLILNAFHAIPEGEEGSITIYSSESPSESPFLVTAVADSGEGIPEESKGRIYDPFFTTKESGTGLGLSIVHKLVNENSGEIDMETKVGRGTTFFLSLPKA